MTRLAVHSVPRSGSTWLGEIFNSSPAVVYRYQPLFSYAFKGRLGPASTRADVDAFFREIAASDDPFIGQHEKRAEGGMPTFEKADPACVVYKEVRYHRVPERLLEVTDDVRVVGLVRNPLAVLNSWLRAPKEFRADQGWDPLAEWRTAPRKNRGQPEEYNGFEKWVEVTRRFQRLAVAYPDRFRLVRYADLLDDPLGTTASLFEWSGLEVGPQTRQFLDESTNRAVDDAYAVYRTHSSDDRWREQLDPRIAAEVVRALRGTDLEPLLDLRPADAPSPDPSS